jgi:quinol monooxygenase YgiN
MRLTRRALMITATLAAATSAAPARADACCAVVELRQYDLKPGKRDALINLFDANFIEPQEAVGNVVMGQFRDVDRPDRFVWLRGFQDMTTRAKALEAFYTGAAWRAHRDAANATMIDVGNVLLLRPLKPLPLGKRPRDEAATGLVEVTIYAFTATVDAGTIAQIDGDIETAGERSIASYISEMSANNFPRLPVRENENVLVRVATFPSVEAHDAHRAKLTRMPQWQALSAHLRPKLKAEPVILRLTPTTRSLTHG